MKNAEINATSPQKMSPFDPHRCMMWAHAANWVAAMAAHIGV
uniref:Uncharacterized protein n=1 Tax=viral metagenome TaxID=1070528 RepID=A0A6C0I5Q2_9ZZZZ